ncbi:MAG: hypothetical protein B6U97_04750, partial [Candidatus Altiarchaeales archaeon ex4484_96]
MIYDKTIIKMLKPVFKQLPIIALFFFLITSTTAQVNDTDASPVGVTLTSKTIVEISPDKLSWSGISPGSVGDAADEENNFFQIQIKNIGSKNITHIWFNASYPKASPFAVGSATATNAGNYVVLSADTQPRRYYFVNRAEYNEQTTLVYLRDPDGNMPPNNTKYSYGRFRNSSNEYFWFLDIEDGNCSDNEFFLGDEAHTPLKTGSTDFSNCQNGLNNTPGAGVSSCRTGTLTRNEKYGFAQVNVGGQNYCLAVSQNCNRTFFSHWNPDYPFNNCGANYSRFAWNT